MKCPPAPKNKKEYISEIGKILVKEHGKKKYYNPEEVKKASKQYNFNSLDVIDLVATGWHCWSMATFSSHADFDAYHEATGEVCDYVSMKTEMLSSLATSTSSLDWLSVPDLDIDASWLDFGDVFGSVLEGIGEFVCGILDGL
ncbi:MAG: hypothetical protein AB8B61_10240 [Cyclobacteriaceae bacterium]